MELVHTIKTGEVKKPTLKKGELYALQLPFAGDSVIQQLRTSGGYYTAPLAKLGKGDKIICKLTSPNQAIGRVSEYKEYNMVYPVHNKGDEYIRIEEGSVYGNEYIIISTTEEGLHIDCEVTTTSVVTIEEPIGFDQFKMTMQRTEYHGISAEVSQLDLEFYGKAAAIIKEAYQADLDTELNYVVTSNGIEVYNGMVDLSTYSETDGQYRSVSCKVGEIGVKTTFNNRSETEVNLNSDKTIDGEKLGELPTWQSLHIPTKHLAYTDLLIRETDETYTRSGGDHPYQDAGIYIGHNHAPYIFLPIGLDSISNEFGTITEQETPYSTNNVSDVAAQYVSDAEHETKYGKETEANVRINLQATITRTSVGWAPVEDNYIRWYLQAEDTEGNIIKGVEHKIIKSEVNDKGATWDISCELKGTLSADKAIKYYLVFDIDMDEATDQYFYAHITIKKGSYVKMTMYDNLQEETKNTNMLMVYDALKTISLMTTENKLPVKSDWYDYSDLAGNIIEQHGGATKAITNGYKIRDIKTESGKEYPMSMSFRDLFESLNAMDCIGWSIVNEEDGLCLRVERWDWFYKDEEVLTIEDVNELKTSLNKDLCVTEFEIGYDKYVTSDVYNSIENLHSERKYASAVKALSNKVSAKSKIIADNYAIEETRRAQFQVKPSESFEHDESVFVFELGAGGLDGSFVIRSSAEDCVGIERPIEFINAKLTPRQCAARWADYLFAMNGAKALKYVTSSANSEAGFSTNNGSLLLSMADQPQMENDDIGVVSHKLKAETLEFTYPLTIDQYKKIKNNPYGLITVNGIQGWLKEFTYSFVDGEAEFKLTPKAN